jgi:hypothetical protein
MWAKGIPGGFRTAQKRNKPPRKTAVPLGAFGRAYCERCAREDIFPFCGGENN